VRRRKRRLAARKTKMKIQCDVCERNKAAVLCCADEAALCTDCDTRVHAANKLANKHQRIHLLSPSDAPRCDICQEKCGFFFCLEDRALLCRECDVSIHSANSLSCNHKRFLIPGIRVALEAKIGQEAAAAEQVPEEAAVPPAVPVPSSRMMTTIHTRNSPLSTTEKPTTATKVKSPLATPSQKSNPAARLLQGAIVLPKSAGMSPSNNTGNQNVSEAYCKSSITEFLTEAVPGWRVDELLNLADLAGGFNTADMGSSKADVSDVGAFDWAMDLSSFDEQVDVTSHRQVPQISSAPTMSGLFCSSRVEGSAKGNFRQEAALLPDFSSAFVVPDVDLCSPSTSRPLTKRSRT
jgi:hypothetical protein